jgi:hypothetical protein
MAVKYDRKKYTIQPGKFETIGAVGNYLFVLDATANFEMSIDGDPTQTFEKGFEVDSPEQFTRLRLENNGGVANTIELMVSDGKIRKNALKIEGSINSINLAGTVPAQGVVAIGVAAGLIKAANATRKVITITNNHGANILYLGTTGAVTTANAGIVLQPGQSYDYECTSDIYGIANGAATDVRYTEISQ